MNELKQLLKPLMNKSLSGNDMITLTRNKAKIMTYPELTTYNNIEDLFYPHKAVILLYEDKHGYGHWTCVIKRGNVIEHFDSYGMKPDDELEFVPDYFRKLNKMVLPHLTALLYYSPKKYIIEYNHGKLQKHDKHITTCGRWVGDRINHINMTIEDYIDMYKNKNLTPDELITLKTLDI